MQKDIVLTDEEKARLVHNAYNREWAKKNREKVRQSRIKSLAKKYDEIMARYEERHADERAGAINER